ncbi:MAG: hypothetical protein P1U63_01900 [Coxiellaceae bacterium]|nr:hypothetical protein [Coxiellaceae bacterium]
MRQKDASTQTIGPMVIVGAGPAGEVLANALSMMGFAVVLIEMRELRLRPQVVSALSYGLKSDIWRTAKVELPYGSQQIKDIEKVLDAATEEKLSVDEEGAPSIQPGKICLYKPYKVIAVDREKMTVTIENTKTDERIETPFQHVFFCEGESRQSLKWMDDLSITYTKRPHQPMHADFALPIFETPKYPHSGDSLELLEYITPAELHEILEYIRCLDDPDDPAKKIIAWDKMYLPMFYTMPHGTRKTKHKLNCEFLVEEPDLRRRQKLIEQWGKKLLHILTKYCSASVEIAEEDIHLLRSDDTAKGRAKYNLRLSSTHVELDRIDQPSMPLTPDGSHCAVWVGGSAASAWFRNANGLGSAMRMAQSAAECLNPATGAWDVAAYAEKVDRIIKYVGDSQACDTVKEREMLAKQQSEKYIEGASSPFL